MQKPRKFKLIKDYKSFLASDNLIFEEQDQRTKGQKIFSCTKQINENVKEIFTCLENEIYGDWFEEINTNNMKQYRLLKDYKGLPKGVLVGYRGDNAATEAKYQYSILDCAVMLSQLEVENNPDWFEEVKPLTSAELLDLHIGNDIPKMEGFCGIKLEDYSKEDLIRIAEYLNFQNEKQRKQSNELVSKILFKK